MKRLFLILAGFFPATLAFSATWNIHYAKQVEELDHRTTYPLSVLSLALEHTNVRYNLIPTSKVILQGKAIKQLKANREINVIWSMTDKVREEELLPVRIPIYKGLIGWRVFLVKDKDKDLFSSFNSIEELRQYQPVQAYDWPDTKILQANGFEVVTSVDYRSMFEMVALERANFFPRSIVEVWTEVNTPALSQGLTVEPYLAVRYPTAMYFFFNKKNKVLANLIETGLRRAIKSGRFDELFMQVHEQYLANANIENRIIFELENPVLPEATPVDDESLWYSVN